MIEEGCRQSGCVCLAGPRKCRGLQNPGNTICRFAVGAVDRKDCFDGRHVRAGDIVLGLPRPAAFQRLFLIRKLYSEKELKTRWRVLAPRGFMSKTFSR